MINLRRLALASVALAVITGSPSRAQKTKQPRFQDYPVAAWRGSLALLNLRSHPLARRYRTLLLQQIKEERVNFAGHYTFATVGCGAGCSINAIIDARTGTAYFPNELSGWTGIVGDYQMTKEDDEPQTRPGSRLLRMLGRPNIGKIEEERHGPSGIYFYEWTHNRLRLVKFVPAGSYPDPDPPAKPLDQR